MYIKRMNADTSKSAYKDMSMMEEDFFGNKRDGKNKTAKKVGLKIQEIRQNSRLRRYRYNG